MIQLAAKHFFVQHGADRSMESARSVVEECINSTLLEAKTEEKWVQMVNTAHIEVRSTFICWFWFVLFEKFAKDSVLLESTDL